jgi:hypothetical protein
MLEEDRRWEEGRIQETPPLPVASGNNSEEWGLVGAYGRSLIGFTPVPPGSDI